MKLVITEPTDFSDNALNALSNKFEIVRLENKNDIINHIKDVEVLFIRLGIVFNEDLMKKAHKLRIICSPTTGLDHINEQFCNHNGIEIISLKNERQFLDSIPSTAEHTWTLLTSINRKLYLATKSVKSKHWDRDAFKSYNLKGKTLGIIGLGRVGKQMANYAKAFQMKAIGFDINSDIKADKHIEMCSVEKLFSESDFISVHIPLNPVNVEFINEDLIDLMQPSACIINTSRGKVWDEKAIAKAIINQKIRGVASDVIYDELEENWQNSPLLSLDPDKYNCIITPHIAGATYDSMHLTEEFIVNKLMKYVG
jgi:D-3-phosphoglycerate dehydrogenase